MRKLLVGCLLAVFMFTGNEALAQLDRNSVRKNNKRLLTYRGKKSNFSKEKRYFSLGLSVNALNYYGDLAPNPGRLSTDISFTRPAFVRSYTYRLGPMYSITG